VTIKRGAGFHTRPISDYLFISAADIKPDVSPDSKMFSFLKSLCVSFSQFFSLFPRDLVLGILGIDLEAMQKVLTEGIGGLLVGQER
jgi:hypothetical protein